MLPFPGGKLSWKQFGGFLLGSGCVWVYRQLRTFILNQSRFPHTSPYVPRGQQHLEHFTYITNKYIPILVQLHTAGSAAPVTLESHGPGMDWSERQPDLRSDDVLQQTRDMIHPDSVYRTTPHTSNKNFFVTSYIWEGNALFSLHYIYFIAVLNELLWLFHTKTFDELIKCDVL